VYYTRSLDKEHALS